jgi:hypothetical protein
MSAADIHAARPPPAAGVPTRHPGSLLGAISRSGPSRPVTSRNGDSSAQRVDELADALERQEPPDEQHERPVGRDAELAAGRVLRELECEASVAG